MTQLKNKIIVQAWKDYGPNLVKLNQEAIEKNFFSTSENISFR